MSLTHRQRAASLLRQIGLLDLADYFWEHYLAWKSRAANRRFKQEQPGFACPPQRILYDILGTCDLACFFYGGRDQAREIARLITTHHGGPTLQILEWGCGPARVLQHLCPPTGGHWQLTGSDYNPETIDWCRRHFPAITFLENRLEPPIPAADASFDVIFCISVFTHLSVQMHREWVKELLRLLKPGGLFIGTFHGMAYREQLTREEQKRFDMGELVIRNKIREGKKNFAAYHPDSSVCQLLAAFDEYWQESSQVFQQSVWCARKRQD